MIDPVDALKVFLAVVLGGAIGIEREFSDKPAGFRTNILVCLGATLFTIISMKITGGTVKDPGRIAAQIVTGIGFLGAGAIIREGGGIVGLTTAATIWVVSAIGVSIGSGNYGTAIVSTSLVVIIHTGFSYVEYHFWHKSHHRYYKVTFKMSDELEKKLDDVISRSGVLVHETKKKRKGNMLCKEWKTLAPLDVQDALTENIIAMKEVDEVEF